MTDHLAFLTRAMAASPDHSMTVRALAIMLYLGGLRSPVLSRDMAHAIDLPKPTVSRLTSHLAKLGLIEKTRGDKDKRDCWLVATEQGRAFLSDAVTAPAKVAA